MKLTVVIAIICCSVNVFANSGAQFGLDKHYFQCLEKLKAQGVSLEEAIKRCQKDRHGELKNDEDTSAESSDKMTANQNDENSIIITSSDDGLVAVDKSVFETALETIRLSDIEVTSDGVFVAGATLTTATLIWKYSRSINPVGAFMIGLGVAPVAASDYCSRFETENGLKMFLDLPTEIQMSELAICPVLANQVLQISESLIQ